MSEFTLPVISNDFLSEQPFAGAIYPSLIQLNDYITCKFKSDFADVNTVALTKYIEETNQPLSNGQYHLFGQLLIDMNTPLTNDLLRNAIKANINRGVDYVPYNSIEAASIYNNKQVFINLLDLLQKYYQHPYDLMEKVKSSKMVAETK